MIQNNRDYDFSAIEYDLDLLPIEHPQVASSVRTCFACPEQYEGTLVDGRSFYFRYRHGRAQLGVGKTVDDAIAHTFTNGPVLTIGDNLQGIFNDTKQRDLVFAHLYSRLPEE